MWIVGYPGAVIDGVRFRNCVFRGVETAEMLSHAGSVLFDKVTIEPAKKGRSLDSRAAASTSP